MINSPTPTPERNGESINYMRPGDSFHCLICHKDMPTKGAQGMDAHRLICEGEATSCGRMNGKACEKQPTPESRLREEWERECIENMNDNIYLSIGATADWWLSKLSQERELLVGGGAVQEQRGRWAKHEQWFYEQLVGVLLHSPHFWDVIVKKVRHGDSIGDAPTTSLTHTKL